MYSTVNAVTKAQPKTKTVVAPPHVYSRIVKLLFIS